jgi:hypothetical protein
MTIFSYLFIASTKKTASSSSGAKTAVKGKKPATTHGKSGPSQPKQMRQTLSNKEVANKAPATGKEPAKQTQQASTCKYTCPIQIGNYDYIFISYNSINKANCIFLVRCKIQRSWNYSTNGC